MANRVSQVGVEVVLLPSSQNARASQVGMETVMVPTPAVRVSQSGAEVIWGPVPGALVSQLGIEVVSPSTGAPGTLADIVSQIGVEVVSAEVGGGNPRITQAVVESVGRPVPNARVTQSVVEVIYKGSTVSVVIESECWVAVQTDFPWVAVPTN